MCDEVMGYVERGGLLKALLKEFGPVHDRSRTEAGKDEVKGTRKVPVIFKVVDVEAYVW